MIKNIIKYFKERRVSRLRAERAKLGAKVSILKEFVGNGEGVSQYHVDMFIDASEELAGVEVEIGLKELDNN